MESNPISGALVSFIKYVKIVKNGVKPNDIHALIIYLDELHDAVVQLEYPAYSFRYIYAMRTYVKKSSRIVTIARQSLNGDGCPTEVMLAYKKCIVYITENYPQ